MKTSIEDIVNLHQPLKPDSTVIDCGGYRGDYSQEVINRWNPDVTIFEPVPEFYKLCKERFKKNLKVEVLPLALGKEIEDKRMYVNKDSSSFYKDWAKSDNSIEVSVVKLSDNIGEEEEIAVLKINCEGAELEILQDIEPRLVQVNEVLIQFHKRGQWEGESILSKTHVKVYDAKWQLWRRRES